jgi:hypothetical protein
MPDAVDALSETVEAWLRSEERALQRLAHRSADPAVAERLQRWRDRVRAYEWFELALAEQRAADRLDALRRAVPDAVERGLRLVS